MKNSKFAKQACQRVSSLLVLLLLGFTPSLGQGAQYGDFTYANDGASITITAYTGPGGAVTIPDLIDGLPVVGISNKVFYRVSSLTSLTIPDSVSYVGSYAFRQCSSLTNIILPDSVRDIGAYAFYGCSNLTGISLPKGLTNINSDVFERCGLTNITIPKTVAGIADYAFYGCTNLISVIFDGNAPKTIGVSVFYGADKAKADYWPGTTGWTAYFAGIPTARRVDPNSQDYYYRQNGSTISINLYLGTNENVVIPATINGFPVTSIGEKAFYQSYFPTNIIIPDIVTNIGYSAFWGCSRLGSITLPNSITRIEAQAFVSCHSLTSVTIPKNITTIGFSVFWGCRNLTNVTFSGNVTNLSDQAFAECTKLTNIILPSNLISFGNAAFGSCSSLTNLSIDAENPHFSCVAGALFNKSQTVVCQWPAGKGGICYVPDTVTNIAPGAFRGCENLTGVTIPDSVTCVGQDAFFGCTGLTEIAVPNGVKTIGGAAFSACNNLTTITIPESVVELGGGAFAECTSLGSITIPSSVTRLNSSLFLWCASLTNIVIPESVTHIDDNVFSGCTSLSSVSLPKNLTSIFSYVFENCSGLKSVFFNGDAPLVVGYHLLDNAAGCTIYYRPGTTGWSSTFAGRSTEPWPSASIQFATTNLFLTWPQGVLEETTNAVTGPWTPKPDAQSPYSINSTGPQKFYRIKLN